MAYHHLACYEATTCWYGGLLPSHLIVLKGIYPGLKDIIECQINDINEKIKSSKTDTDVEVLPLPDAKKDPDRATIDPFGNDFNCKLCKKELSNTYMHCEGCEILLQKDFNICTDCHANDTRRLKNVTMHPTRPLSGRSSAGKRADYNHMPGATKEKKNNCSCKNGPPCRQCGYMICCSCKCHQKYSLRTRFRDASEIKSLLNGVQLAIGIEVDDVDSSADGNKDNRNIFDATAYASTKSHGGTTVPEMTSVDIAVQLISNADGEKDISQKGVRRKRSETVSKPISKQDISNIIEDKKQEIDEMVEKKVRELDSRRKVSERRSEVTSMKNIRELIKKEVQEIEFPKDIEILKRKVKDIVENEKITERKIREIQEGKDKAIEALQQEVEYIKNSKERSLLEYQRQVRELGEKVQQVIGKQRSILKPDPPS
uniref:Uncharacterized protein n=2 Tax=Chaetoceros debilis TaxID=122233 RepID=A0A7S3VAZ2_9STRA